MSASLDISSQVDRSEITIGDRIHYEIKVVYPKDGHLVLPSVLGNLGSFEVKDYQASEPKDAGNLKIQTWRFDLSTFTVGKYTIPPQVIEYREGTDTTSKVYYTQPIEINVKRTSPETVKDIADIAPLVDVAAPTPWLLYGLGAWVLLAVAFVAWRLLRKHKPAEAEKGRLPPYEEAMKTLTGLKDLSLIRQNRAREFCFVLSEALRRYLSRRYGIDAMESTTSEFLEKARTLPVTGAQKQWLGEFCEKTDLVKFANALLLESDAGAMLAATEKFVRETKPREEDLAGQAADKPAAPPSKPAAAKPPAPAAKNAPKPGPKPKTPPGGGFIQGGHGHDDDPNRGWTA